MMDEVDEPALAIERPEQKPRDATGMLRLQRQAEEADRAKLKLHVKTMLQSLPTLGSADMANVHGEISQIIDRTYSNTTEVATTPFLYFVVGLISGSAIAAVWARHNYGLWPTILLYALAFLLGSLIATISAIAWFFSQDSPTPDYLWSWTYFNPGNETATPPTKIAKPRHRAIVALCYVVLAIIALLVVRKHLNSYLLDTSFIGILSTACALLLTLGLSKASARIRRSITTLVYVVAVAISPLLLAEYGHGYLFDVFITSVFAATSALLFAWILPSIVSRSSAIGAALACAAAATISVVVLREHLSYVLDILLVSILTAASALLLALIGSRIDSAKRRGRMIWPSPQGKVLPLDHTIVNLLNLSYFLHMSGSKRDLERHAQRAIEQIEYAARDAEAELPGCYRTKIRRDQRGAAWAQETSLRLAESIRLSKRTIMMAARAKDFQGLCDNMTSTLVAATNRDWKTLLVVDEVSRTPALLRRWTWQLAPTAILVAMAFLLPILLGLDFRSATATGVRISLLISAVLSLLAAFSPNVGKTAEIIQSAQDRLTSGPKGGG